jgi:hypothetical protein
MEKNIEDKLATLEEAEEFAKKRNYKYTTEQETISYKPNVHVAKWLTPEEIEKITRELDGN